jgi:Ca2+-binding EF-hand superfamily protein
MPKKAAPAKQTKHDDNKLTGDFTEQEILEFREAFAMFDMDGGGTCL